MICHVCDTETLPSSEFPEPRPQRQDENVLNYLAEISAQRRSLARGVLEAHLQQGHTKMEIHDALARATDSLRCIRNSYTHTIGTVREALLEHPHEVRWMLDGQDLGPLTEYLDLPRPEGVQ